MKDELINILRCPETRQPLCVADPALIARLNSRFTAGALRHGAGQGSIARIESGLVRADGRVLYPVRNGVPVLLVEEAIPIE
jgi:uncharacterized protein YbaR (Trm112 family)